MDDVQQPPQAQAAPPEPVADRARRHRRRGGLYAWAFLFVALLVIVAALAGANTRQVKLSWVVGSSTASLVWVVVAAAVLGWLLGLTTSIVFRLRTRRHAG